MRQMSPVTSSNDWMAALQGSDSAWLMTDAHLHTIQVNDGFTRMLGYSLDDMRGQPPLQKLMQIPGQPLPVHILEQLSINGVFSGELQLYTQDGQPVWVSATINAFNRQQTADGPVFSQVLVLTDIGFTKRFEALQRQMLEDVVTEKPLDMLLSDMCRALEQLVPHVHVSVMHVDETGLMNPLAAPSIPEHIVELMRCVRMGADVGACGAAAFLGREVIAHDISEDPNWCNTAPLFVEAGLRACWSSPIKNRDDRVVGTLAFYFDTARSPNALHRQLVLACLHLCAIAIERDASKHRIRQLAYYDTLTHLPNRTMFNEDAARALHAERGQCSLLFFLDLDRFKLWNDSLGHTAGDALLCEIAERLRQCARPHDVVGRLSSDEFAVLMPRCTPEQIPTLAQHMLDAISVPFGIHGVMTTPNACIGVCVCPEDGADIETLLRHADQAMYAAKKQGCQRWERYKPEMGQLSLERADMERALRTALTEGALQLHYQPQVFSQGQTRQGELYGLEALARWHHPQWGWVAPPRFIAVAEDAGLIHALTRWLMDTACAQLAQWRAAGIKVPHVAVNLSTKNFHDPSFALQVQATLSKHGLSAHDLMLEITESVMLDSSPTTLENLAALHASGMRLSMDDFGTGYSSLSYLHRLPISELKLDKSFVQDVTTSAAAAALTRSVLNIAHSLGMAVVAEGVETQAQADWLGAHGCQILQGYLLARPMPPQALASWVTTALP